MNPDTRTERRGAAASALPSADAVPVSAHAPTVPRSTVASAASGPTGRLTRVTLIGPQHRIDLVLPSEEPVGVLLPEIVTMIGYGPTGDPRGYQVSMLDGQVLEPSSNLRQAGVTDGTLLRIDPLTEAPPAAVLHDVSDEVADDLARRRGRWNESARRRTATLAVIVSALLAGQLAMAALTPTVVTVVGTVVLLAGSGVALIGQRQVGIATLLAGATIVIAAVPFLTVRWPERLALYALAVGVTVLMFGIATRQPRAGLLGAGTLLGLLGLWTGMVSLRLPMARTAAIMAVISVGCLGVLPRMAMMAAGLTRLDDRQSNDEPVTRVVAEAVVDSAHRALGLACVATAASGMLAGWQLAQAGTGWTIGLSCLVAVTLLLRLRAFPLTVEVVSLVIASLVIETGLLVRWMQVAPKLWWGAVAVEFGVAAVGLVVLGYQPQRHVRARVRQIADRLEAVAVVGLVPVAVGVFGLYSRLLHTF